MNHGTIQIVDNLLSCIQMAGISVFGIQMYFEALNTELSAQFFDSSLISYFQNNFTKTLLNYHNKGTGCDFKRKAV